MTTGMLTLLLSLGLGAPPSDVYTMRSRNLEIPIRVNESKRNEIRELELHVSTDQGRTWVLAGRAKPDQQVFAFRAPSDGTYWFGVTAVDRSGKRDPEDIASTPPALKVLIDTAHSALQIVAIDRVGDEIQVAWDCTDAQADPASLRLEYRPAGSDPATVWSPVPVPPQVHGTYRFRPLHGGAITLRMQITDSTGAPATVLKDVPAGAAPSPTPAPVANAVAPPPQFPTTPAPVAAAPVMQQTNSISQPPAPAPALPIGQMPAMVNPQPAQPIDPPPPVVTSTNHDAPSGPPALQPMRTNTGAGPRTNASPLEGDHPPSVGTQNRVGPLDVQHVHDRVVAIEYEVDRKGPSGVKKVEVYMTQDDGRTWRPYSDSFDVNPPLQLTLPEKDGLYGFRLVLYSGVNQSIGPPQAGEPPDVRLLVDRTAPQVEIYAPVPDPLQPNALVLRYRAGDTNLVVDSVALSWSARPDAGWQPINAGPSRPSQWAGVKECVWNLPPDVPDGVYLRLTARDQAGNVGQYTSPGPVTVDLQKPIARVKAVVPAAPRR